MLRSVFSKSIRDERRALVGWSVGFGLLALWIVLVYPSYAKSADEMSAFFEKAPAAFRALFGGTVDLGTPEGFLNTELFSLMAPLLFIIFSVVAGSRSVAGEERRGTLDLLMSHPVGRERVVAEKFAAVAATSALLGLVLAAVLVAGAAAIGMDIGMWRLAATTMLSALLGLTYGAIAFAVGAATGRRGLAVGAASGLAVAAYLVNGLGLVVGWIEPLRAWSPWYYFAAADPLRNGADLAHTGILLGLTAAMLAVAVAGFRRRDLGV